MKPCNFPDRKERRRRVALDHLQKLIEKTPGTEIPKRRANEYATLKACCGNDSLRPRDISLREAAGDRRKPGVYKGLRG